MIRLRGLAAAGVALSLAACASTTLVPPPAPAELGAGWTPAAASVRAVGLGLPGGARLDDSVTFAGGVEIVVEAESPLHSLSDLKLAGGGFVAVSDAGDLVRGRLTLDGDGRLAGVKGLQVRRLTLRDGTPIADKADGDAEGLLITPDGDLLISFERDHRIWNYGPADRPARHPTPVARPEAAFPPNDGMEAISANAAGLRVAGESGGVWDCTPALCSTVLAPPETPLADSDYRLTGMDRDPFDDGFFVVQRSFSPPIDARARIRRMAPDGSLGPVLVELKLPGTTDNFEGLAVIARAGGARLYILSDDNNNPVQRTLLLAFDVRYVR